jgi:hypothetical protein
MKFRHTLGGIARFVLTTCAVGAISPAKAQDVLYGLLPDPNCCWRLDRIDTVTGDVDWDPIPAFPTWFRCLTNGTGGLLGFTQTSLQPNRIAAIHPADAAWSFVATTVWSNLTGAVGFDRNPVNGVYYYTDGISLFEYDLVANTATLVAAFTGTIFPQTPIYSIGFLPNGVGIAAGNGRPMLGQPMELYLFDPATAVLMPLPGVVIPGALGNFWDFAVNSNGDVYASFWTPTNLYAFASGIYKIDIATGTATLVKQAYPGYTGLTFMPATQQTNYCTAKVNSLGCTPTIEGDGFPSSTASSGYTISASNLRNQSWGALTIGVRGRAALPFGGGVMCVRAPRRTIAPQGSGGSALPAADCSGVWSLDFNTWMDGQVELPAGVAVQAQWLGRDSGFAAPNNWTLTDALEFILRP